VQDLVDGMAADLWRVARSNANRCHPDSGTTSNNYCKGTRPGLDPNFFFNWDKTDQRAGFGMFDSFWTCDIIFPRATG
jgi:hypothetical protein